MNREGLAPGLPAALLGALPLLGAGAGPERQDAAPAPPWAVVEVTAPRPLDPMATVVDPRHQGPAGDGAEVLRTVPGFGVVRKGGSGGDPVLRGMAGSRVAIRSDGEETPGGCGGRMDPPTAYLFPESFDRITVVKGPQTVRYGPGASAGTVRFERAPRDRDQPWAVNGGWMAGSGRNDRALELEAGTRSLYGRVVGIRAGSPDYRCGDGRAIPSRYSRWSSFGALGWTPGDRTRLELRGTRSDGEAAYADRGMDGVRFRRSNLGAAFETGWPGTLVEKLECQVYANTIDHVMDNASLRRFTPSPAAPEPMARNPQQATRGARLALTLGRGEAGQWVVGADQVRSRHTVRRSPRQWSVPVQRLPRVADAILEHEGLFGEWARDFSGGHRLVAGLREDRWQAEDQRTQLGQGRAGNLPNPTAWARREQFLTSWFARCERTGPSGTAVFAGLGHVQRAPDYWELFAAEGETLPSAFRTRPERTTQLDIGASLRVGAARLSVSGFHGWVGDFILIQSGFPKPAPAGEAQTATVARNIQARTWGGEATLAVPLAGSLRLDGSLACAWGENRTDARPLAQLPPPETRLGLTWEEPAWSVGALVRLVAPQDRFAVRQGSIAGQDLGRTPGFAVFSLSAGWRPGGGRPFQVTAGIDNLFDRAYVEALNRAAGGAAGVVPSAIRLPEPGRTFWIRLGLKASGRGSG